MNVNLFGPLNSTGLGTHFYNWAKFMIHQLTPLGVNVCVIPRGPMTRPELRQEHPAGLDAALIDSIQLQKDMSFKSPGIMLWHPHDMSQFCGGPRIGYTVWETTRLTDREVNHLSQLDVVAVPTEWHRKGLLEALAGNTPPEILVWHEGVDNTYYIPRPIPMGPLQRSGFTFVNVGKFEHRKGQHVLIEAFSMLATTMQKGYPIRLLAGWDNPWLGETWLPRVTRCLQTAGFSQIFPENSEAGVSYTATHTANPDATIQIFKELPDRDAVRNLYWAADAGVFPFFAEGWGLSVVEMMAMAKPVAATAWGAPLEYLTEGSYFPIKGGQEAQAFDKLFYHGDRGNWYQVSAEDVYDVMLHMIEITPEQRAAIGQNGSMHIQSGFTWMKSASKAVADLEDMEVLR